MRNTFKHISAIAAVATMASGCFVTEAGNSEQGLKQQQQKHDVYVGQNSVTVTQRGFAARPQARVGIGSFNYTIDAPANLGAYCATGDDAIDITDDVFARSVFVEVDVPVLGTDIVQKTKRPVTWAEMARVAVIAACRESLDLSEFPDLKKLMDANPSFCLDDTDVDVFQYGTKVIFDGGFGLSKVDGGNERTKVKTNASQNATVSQFLNDADKQDLDISSAAAQATKNAYTGDSSSFAENETGSGSSASSGSKSGAAADADAQGGRGGKAHAGNHADLNTSANAGAIAGVVADVRAKSGVNLNNKFTIKLEGEQDHAFNSCKRELQTACGDILINMQNSCRDREKQYSYTGVREAKNYCASQGTELPRGYCREMCQWLKDNDREAGGVELQAALDQAARAWSQGQAKIKAGAAGHGDADASLWTKQHADGQGGKGGKAGSDSVAGSGTKGKTDSDAFGAGSSGGETSQSGSSETDGDAETAGTGSNTSQNSAGQSQSNGASSSQETITERDFDSTTLRVDVGFRAELPSKDVLTRAKLRPFYNTRLFDKMHDQFRDIWKAQLKGVFCGQHQAKQELLK